MIEQLRSELVQRGMSVAALVALGGLGAAGYNHAEAESQMEGATEAPAISTMVANVALSSELAIPMQLDTAPEVVAPVVTPKAPAPKPAPAPHPRPVAGGPASALPKACNAPATGRLSCVMKGPAPTAVLARVENGTILDLTVTRSGDTATKVVTVEGLHNIYRKEENHQVSETKAERDARLKAHKPAPIMRWSAFFDPSGEAFHYSSNFEAVWYNGRSEGCLNLRNLKFAQKFYNWAQIGDPVQIVPKSLRVNARALRVFNPDDLEVADFDFAN